MSQKIVFQDNIFQITRSLDIIKDGMNLNLSEDIFAKKTMNDILFFDFALQNIFNKIELQTHLPNYLDTMQCLYFCITKYIDILAALLSNKNNNSLVIANSGKIESIYQKYGELKDKIQESVQDESITQDEIMVSETELSQLLQFG